MQYPDSFLSELLRDTKSDNWIIFSLLGITIAYVLIKLIYGRFWRRYRQALLYNQETNKLSQEKNVLLMQAAVSMNVMAIFSGSMFVFLFLIRFNIFESLPNTFYGWMLVTLFVILIFGGKYLLNIILGYLGNNVIATSQINHQWLINVKNFGFFLLPFSIVAAFIYSPLDGIVFFMGLFVLIFMLIMNYIKGFLILFQYRISIYYGILYLCTLEILPVLIVWKLIQE
jgi:hypothetical protein